MRSLLAKSDALAGGVASVATTLGQCALVALGVHLAADNLDDRVLSGLTALQTQADQHLAEPFGRLAAFVGQDSSAFLFWDGLPLGVGSAWIALCVEAVATVLLWGSFVLTARRVSWSWPRFKRALSVQAVVLPAALAGVLLAGTWSLAMGVEDVLPAHRITPWAAGLVALAALLRFGWPAWSRAVVALEPPPRWTRGAAAALVLVPVGALAWVHGVPLWGLLS